MPDVTTTTMEVEAVVGGGAGTQTKKYLLKTKAKYNTKAIKVQIKHQTTTTKLQSTNKTSKQKQDKQN